jgi:hypothetical protein
VPQWQDAGRVLVAEVSGFLLLEPDLPGPVVVELVTNSVEDELASQMERPPSLVSDTVWCSQAQDGSRVAGSMSSGSTTLGRFYWMVALFWEPKHV